MTNDQIRISIAEKCGWTEIGDLLDTGKGPDGLRDYLPDYPNDLNAMHEAEKVLTDEQRHLYAWLLVQMVDSFDTYQPDDYDETNVWEMSLWDCWDTAHATAAQRAEAFCRTLFPERFSS